MRIVHLKAENYKRLVAIEVTPEGHLIDVSGRNAQGKSSLLDSIFAALAGKDAIPSKPIRKGADSALIEVKLGDGSTVKLTVRRTFTRREDDTFATSVVVENAEGLRYGSPQKMLDGLLGALSFDPLAFARMPAKDQLGQLRNLVPGVDFEAIDAANKEDYDMRTDVNRRAKSTRAQIEALKVPGDPRQERVDESALVAELEAAGERRAEIERETMRRRELAANIERHKADANRVLGERADLLKQIADLQEQAENALDRAARITAHAEGLEDEVKALPPLADPPATIEIRARIDTARKTNLVVTERERVLKQREELDKTIAMLEKQAGALTTAIDSRERQKGEAVAAAQLPVEGLGLGADGVLFNGLPLEQASDAERLRVSVAIAAAMNPKLRVIRIRDGSLLDIEGVRAIAEFAEKNDLQIWREVVSDDAKTGIVIEDGRVAAKEAAA